MYVFGVHWGAPENYVYLFLVIVAGVCALYRLYRLKHIYSILAKPIDGVRFLRHASMKKMIVKSLLWIVGYLFLTLTLLHPQWNKKEETVCQQGRDLFIALDISRSMLATDVEPNRLEQAKEKIKMLTKKLGSERVGLILFSGSAFVSCPLTSDYGAFYMFLNQVDATTISSGSTSLQAPIKVVLDHFKATSTRKNKLQVIFTDGEDFSTDLSQIKKQAHDEGLTIITVGIGTSEGAPIPLLDRQGNPAGHLRDKKGSIVISRLNQDVLESITQQVGGLHIQASKDHHDVDSIVKLITTFEKERIGDRTFSRYQEQYPYFLVVSFVCYLIEWLL